MTTATYRGILLADRKRLLRATDPTTIAALRARMGQCIAAIARGGK